ncbi:MAG: tRNA dihydrouridine synthase DusB [Eggerthellaceae bacterium]|nr:tRNA dihydrouridine synthase DusB [Eggerthellaceae bacterium]
MAGVNDVAFRQLCKEQGATLTFTEMVSTKALSFGSQKSQKLLDRAPLEDVVGIQIFGHEPKIMAQECVVIAENMTPHVSRIDINMGCPVRKIAGKGDGAALLKDPVLAAEIVQACARALAPYRIPLSIKMRMGYARDENTAPDFALRMQEAGAQALTIHGRTAAQMYTGVANWDVIAQIKEALSIPVVANGDVKSAQDAVDIIEHTGADAIMVARAVRGNPWLFAQMTSALAGDGILEPPSLEMRIETAKKHVSMLSQSMGNHIVYMRKHIAWYMYGIPGAARARGAINSCITQEDFYAVLDDIYAYAREFNSRHHEVHV